VAEVSASTREGNEEQDHQTTDYTTKGASCLTTIKMTGDIYSGTLSAKVMSELKAMWVSVLATLQESKKRYETGHRELQNKLEISYRELENKLETSFRENNDKFQRDIEIKLEKLQENIKKRSQNRN
jgi:hypothetical protein